MSLNIEISKDGYKILRIDQDNKKIYLGSKYNQKREIDKFISSIKDFTYKDNFIVFGLSFGEHIEELLKLIGEDNSKILIVELNKEHLEYCKNDNDIKKIIENDKVTVTFDKDEIERFMLLNVTEINAERLQILDYCNYMRIYKQEYKETFKLIRDLLVRIKINRNTISTFGNRFSDNTISNLEYIVNSTPVNNLKDRYINKPAIIVSAGPSLAKNIDHLKEVNNALILSGGRTIEALLERNINPTCLGVIDPGESSYKLVENCIDKVECPLIFCDMTNEKVVSNHKKEKFFYSSSSIISKAFEQNIQTLYGGGSIAHTLTNLAVYIGCNPIIFIGQDLANTDEKNHASCCKPDWDGSNVPENKEGNDIYVKGINGDLVKTNLTLNDFRISLERIISKNPNVKFINATEGGAFIEGAENKRLKDIIGEFKEEEIIPMVSYFEKFDKKKDVRIELEHVLKSIYEYIKLCNQAKRFLKEYEISYRSNNQKKLNVNIKKLNEIDKKIIEKNHMVDFIGIIIAKVIYEIENDKQFLAMNSDSKDVIFNKELNRSRNLYSRLGTSINCYKEKLEEIIDKIKEDE